jgi:hypothetical protein
MTAEKPPFEFKTIPGPTAEERAAKQRKADRMLTKARRTYRLSATERRATRRYLRNIAVKGNRPWYAIRTGFRAHLAVSPMTLTTFCFHRCRETTTGEPTAPLGMCRTCLRRWNRAVADAKAMHVPRDIEFREPAADRKHLIRPDDTETITVCGGCAAAAGITAEVREIDRDMLPAWPCAHADETDPLAGPDDPQTWRDLVEDRKRREAESRAKKARHDVGNEAKRSFRKPITDDEY